MPKTTTTTSRRRKRGGGGGDEGDAADGQASNKRRPATSVLTSLDVNDAPRPELPLFQLSRPRQQAGQDDDDEEEEEEEVTGGGGGGGGGGPGSSSLSAPAAAAAGNGHGPHQQRRLWVKDRSRAWWDQCSSADYPEADFRAAFRMGRATFAMLCDALGSAVAKEDTALRAAIPVRQRVAVCVWRLATGEPLRLVSKRFGLGISTCHKLVLEVCAAIRGLLMPRFLRWPDAAAAEAFKARFQAESGIPGVVGAIYTTHIPIIAPKTSVAAYFNRRHTERNHKTSYSVTLQGVVGPDGAFTDVCIGWPGSMPDDQVLERSALQQRAAAGMMAGSWVVGGASFPLTDWVLAPYAQANLTWAQHAFNEKVAEVRRVAVDAFVRLKGRWACLQKRTEVKLQDLPVVLGACCVLHNICESRGEGMDPAGRLLRAPQHLRVARGGHGPRAPLRHRRRRDGSGEPSAVGRRHQGQGRHRAQPAPQWTSRHQILLKSFNSPLQPASSSSSSVRSIRFFFCYATARSPRVVSLVGTIHPWN